MKVVFLVFAFLAVAFVCVYFASKIKNFLRAKRAATVQEANALKNSAADYAKKQVNKL